MVDPALGTLKAGVALVIDRDPHDVADSLLLCSTEELIGVRDQLDALIARQLQALDVRCVVEAERGRRPKSWLVEEQHFTDAEASRMLSVARALPSRPVMAAALRDATLNLEQAKIITRCLRRLDPDVRDVAEKELVDAAEFCSPAALAAFCRELATRFGPETAEAAAQRKYDSRWLTVSSTYDGMHRIDGMLDPVSAATVLAALEPLMRRLSADNDRTTGQRRADALVGLADSALSHGELPDHGGDRPHVTVTLPYDQLVRGLLDTETSLGTIGRFEITPQTARMLACDAKILPVVLGGNSEVLDLGHATDTWTTAQRRALNVESGGKCGWPNSCQGGADHAHHIIFLSRHGPTSTRNGVYLCRFHHRLIHHTDWQIAKDHNGKITVWRK